jgi:sporulation protein YlmC with PRC-barrel domain
MLAANLSQPVPDPGRQVPVAEAAFRDRTSRAAEEKYPRERNPFHMRTIQEIETWYGQPLYDSAGSKIGEISDSLLEGETGQPAWLTVKTGGFGKKEALVPVHGASPSDDGVRVPYDEAQIKDAPSMKPDQELSDDEVRHLYAHYALDFSVAPAGDDGDTGATTESAAAPPAAIVAPQRPITQANMGD